MLFHGSHTDSYNIQQFLGFINLISSIMDLQVREKQEAKAAEKAAAKAAEDKEEAQIRAYYNRQQAHEQQQLQHAASRSSHTSARSSPFGPSMLHPHPEPPTSQGGTHHMRGDDAMHASDMRPHHGHDIFSSDHARQSSHTVHDRSPTEQAANYGQHAAFSAGMRGASHGHCSHLRAHAEPGMWERDRSRADRQSTYPSQAQIRDHEWDDASDRHHADEAPPSRPSQVHRGHAWQTPQLQNQTQMDPVHRPSHQGPWTGSQQDRDATDAAQSDRFSRRDGAREGFPHSDHASGTAAASQDQWGHGRSNGHSGGFRSSQNLRAGMASESRLSHEQTHKQHHWAGNDGLSGRGHALDEEREHRGGVGGGGGAAGSTWHDLPQQVLEPLLKPS